LEDRLTHRLYKSSSNPNEAKRTKIKSAHRKRGSIDSHAIAAEIARESVVPTFKSADIARESADLHTIAADIAHESVDL